MDEEIADVDDVFVNENIIKTFINMKKQVEKDHDLFLKSKAISEKQKISEYNLI